MRAPRWPARRHYARGSYRHRCADRCMVLVVAELEVLVAVVEDARRPAADAQCWCGQRSALQLQLRLLEMIEVQVTIATGPDELAGNEVALLREQVREQRVAGDVERYPEKNVGAALVHLARQAPGGHVQLKERMA